MMIKAQSIRQSRRAFPKIRRPSSPSAARP